MSRWHRTHPDPDPMLRFSFGRTLDLTVPSPKLNRPKPFQFSDASCAREIEEGARGKGGTGGPRRRDRHPPWARRETARGAPGADRARLATRCSKPETRGLPRLTAHPSNNTLPTRPRERLENGGNPPFPGSAPRPPIEPRSAPPTGPARRPETPKLSPTAPRKRPMAPSWPTPRSASRPSAAFPPARIFDPARLRGSGSGENRARTAREPPTTCNLYINRVGSMVPAFPSHVYARLRPPTPAPALRAWQDENRENRPESAMISMTCEFSHGSRTVLARTAPPDPSACRDWLTKLLARQRAGVKLGGAAMRACASGSMPTGQGKLERSPAAAAATRPPLRSHVF